MPSVPKKDDASAEPVFRLRLKDGIGVASFMAGTEAVELSDADPVFETKDRLIYAGARELPFLEEAE